MRIYSADPKPKLASSYVFPRDNRVAKQLGELDLLKLITRSPFTHRSRDNDLFVTQAQLRSTVWPNANIKRAFTASHYRSLDCDRGLEAFIVSTRHLCPLTGQNTRAISFPKPGKTSVHIVASKGRATRAHHRENHHQRSLLVLLWSSTSGSSSQT